MRRTRGGTSRWTTKDRASPPRTATRCSPDFRGRTALDHPKTGVPASAWPSAPPSRVPTEALLNWSKPRGRGLSSSCTCRTARQARLPPTLPRAFRNPLDAGLRLSLMPSSNPRTSMLVALVAAGFLATIACSSSSGSPSSAPQANAATEAAGGEVNWPYTDSRFHYRIDAPGRMTANPDGTAAYLGPSDRLEITIVQGSAASNPGALASQDIKSLSTAATAFYQLSNPTTLTLNGHQVT